MSADIGPVVLARDAEGEFLLPAEMLAARFGWSVQVFRDYMRKGLVSSKVEQGVDEDAGRWRLPCAVATAAGGLSSRRTGRSAASFWRHSPRPAAALPDRGAVTAGPAIFQLNDASSALANSKRSTAAP